MAATQRPRSSRHDEPRGLEPLPELLREMARAWAAKTTEHHPFPVPPRGPTVHHKRAGGAELDMAAFFRSTHGDPPATAGAPVQVHEMLFASGPDPTLLDDGRVELRFETLQPAPAAVAYFGTVTPRQSLAVPRSRFVSRGTVDATGKRHRVVLDPRKLLKERYDMAAFGALGEGLLTWRVEVYDAARGTTRIADGRLALSCSPIPCERKKATIRALPTITLGPLVEKVSRDAMTVVLETDVPTMAAILVDGDVRTDAANPLAARSATPARRHELRVSGLKPGTSVRYEVVVFDGAGATRFDRGGRVQLTPAPTERAVTLALMSDSRSGVDVGDRFYAGVNLHALRTLSVEAFRRGAEAIIFPGDLIDGYTTVRGDFERQLRAWLHAVEPIAAHVPIYEGMGNHEALLDAWEGGFEADKAAPSSAEAVFAALMTNPENGPPPVDGQPPWRESVFSVDIGPVHAAMLNTNRWIRNRLGHGKHPAGPGGNREGMLDDTQLTWLDADLTAARKAGARHLIVSTHEPAFPCGGHTKDAMWWHGKRPEVLAMRDRFWSLLVKHEVLLFVSGDEHNYSRLKVDTRLDKRWKTPVWHVVSGGVGAPFYAQEQDVPWAKHVAVFEPRQHVVMLHADAERATLRAVDITGEVFDEVVLTDR